MNNGKITFKTYSMEQMSLLPPSLEELTPEKHLVRVVNRVVDELGIEPETVFGDIKHNMGFRRFMLRGLKKVNVEWGLVCMAHNLRKLAIQ